MKTWVSPICFYKLSLKYLFDFAKMYEKISGSWSYPEFKGPRLLIRDEKYQICSSTSKNFKQVIRKISGYGIFIDLSFYIETSLNWRSVVFDNFLFCLLMSQ